jgi:PPOX class probable F420-dependent enzyme
MRELVAAARVATMATISPDGLPHLVPCVLALAGDTVYTPVDAKPKSTRRLRRITNMEREARVALLVHEWVEDWSRLWWVRLEGLARIVTALDELAAARSLLLGKYPQYADASALQPVVGVDIRHWQAWSASPQP